MKQIVFVISGPLLGFVLSWIFFTKILPEENFQVIGFLPYWLTSKTNIDSQKYLTTLTYFGLTADIDGKILKLQSLQEEEPGWHNLTSNKVDSLLKTASSNHKSLSLLIFNGNEASISALMEDPTTHAKNLIEDIKPIMQKYKFSDLNLDIESTSEASPEAQLRFSQFTQEVKKGLDGNNLGTLTIDISPDSLIHQRLINLAEVIKYVDQVVLMTYDFHYLGSQVTGPVAPLAGAGTISEYDTKTALQKALQVAPFNKIILGIPLYGYEWETIRDATRSATIPSSGLVASTKRIEQLIKSCATCSAQLDKEAGENYLVYEDSDTHTFHQIFFPSKSSTQAKIDLAKQEKLKGVAYWALGYESADIIRGW